MTTQDKPAVGPLSAGGDWLTIDTAPKDGSRFESQDRTNYKRRVFKNTYWYVHPAVQGFVTEEFDCADYEFEPTHWRPARLAPTASVEAGGSERKQAASGARLVANLASYCGGETPECTDTSPCYDCLKMANVFERGADPFGAYVMQLGDLLRPQPSGETREAVARLTRDLEAHPGNKSVCVFSDDLRTILALLRPAAPGGGDDLRAACQAVLDDYQTSETHHPDHILIRRADFERIAVILSSIPASEGGEG